MFKKRIEQKIKELEEKIDRNEEKYLRKLDIKERFVNEHISFEVKAITNRLNEIEQIIIAQSNPVSKQDCLKALIAHKDKQCLVCPFKVGSVACNQLNFITQKYLEDN